MSSVAIKAPEQKLFRPFERKPSSQGQRKNGLAKSFNKACASRGRIQALIPPSPHRIRQSAKRGTKLMSGLHDFLAEFDRICGTFSAALQNAEFHNCSTLLMIALLSWSLFGTRNDFG
jgi:hypothetical protein